MAFVNLHAVVFAEPGAMVAPSGLKARLLGSVLTVRKPWAVALVGVLFALSFDTVSQAALFALAAGRFGGVEKALFVAALFVLGMLVVDGIDGAWISALIRRADRVAIITSKVMAIAVAAISLAVGIFTIARSLIPVVDASAEGHELALGAAREEPEEISPDRAGNARSVPAADVNRGMKCLTSPIDHFEGRPRSDLPKS